MAASVNMAIILGNLGSAPELKYTQTGKPFCNFSVATSEKWADNQGVQHEKTEWHRIAVWGKQAENCKKYLSKGSSVFIEGRLSSRSWDDQQGQKHYMTEIVAESVKFMSRRPEQQQPEYADGP